MALRNVIRNVLRTPNRDPLDVAGGGAVILDPTLKLWAQFNTGITVTGSGVSQWADQSGHGNHLLQATDTKRPSQEVDGSVLFDGVDNVLEAAGFTLDQPETVYILFKQITWSTSDVIFDGSSVNRGQLFQDLSTPNIALYCGGAGILTLSPTLALNTYGVITSVLNGASSALQLDANAAVTGSLTSIALNGFVLGANAGGGSAWANIQVKEVRVFNVAHDATERAAIITELQAL